MPFEYRAVRIRQTELGKWLVFFAAPASEIDGWAGVPRKTKIGTDETNGFQRELNLDRLASLKEFYRNPSNIIQNPLLLATRAISTGDVTFTKEAGDEFSETGRITIKVEPLVDYSLRKLLLLVKGELESRVPHLKDGHVPKETLQSLKLKAQLTTDEVEDDTDEDEGESTEDSEESVEASDNSVDQGQSEALGAAVLEESHIYDFWVEVAARAEILAEVPSFEGHEFLGFKKDDLISFLLPVVVVDGQHRLWGANETAKSLVDEQKSEIESAIAAGESATDLQRALMAKLSRKLPVSLLMVDDPAEHVFQFVVVNQKATQIGTALLGTIVSTSLSNDELERVADRLSKAGIKLEDSRVISYLARHHSSPFCDLVERGLQGDAKDLLPWTVLGSLASIFRKLKGGKLYNQPKNDYAGIWRLKFLPSSALVADWESKGFKSEYEYWQQPDGPWRLVFITFWTELRSALGSAEGDEWNVWGKARTSNLFNKISLTILTADFFQYLCEVKQGIDSVEDLKHLISDWLTDVKPKYFGRDWKLSGVKKDSTGIRKRWSKLWVDYRKNPVTLPKISDYRTPDND
jgi:hypothetical protein